MKITKDLKIAFSVETETHGTLLVHSASIGRETFELYFAELGKTFHKCFGGDEEAQHVALVGPQIAFVSLKASAVAVGTWDTPSGVKNGFVNELIRRTMVAYADAHGWKQIPMASAQARGIMDEDAAEEVLNSLVFFTAVSKVAPKKLAAGLLTVVAGQFDWEFGSWDFSEYIASSVKSTPAATSTTPVSSVIA